jgi:hypothetical protein
MLYNDEVKKRVTVILSTAGPVMFQNTRQLHIACFWMLLERDKDEIFILCLDINLIYD